VTSPTPLWTTVTFDASYSRNCKLNYTQALRQF